MCVECVDAARASVLRRWRKIRRYKRFAQRKWRAANVERARAMRVAKWLEKKQRGICVRCNAPAAEDSVECAKHRERSREQGRNSYRRRRGSKEIRKLARPKMRPGSKPRIQLISSRRPSRRIDVVAHQAVDAVLYERRIRLLAQLRFMEWPTAGELFDALGVPKAADDPTEYAAWSKMLSRFVADGLIETRRIGRMQRDYSITDKGLALVREAQAQARRAA
jgi:DNA-binding MarR family transcriptional regulator